MAEERIKSSIQVITRMMTLLDALARQPAPVNLKHLAGESQLHPSTAYRILNVMVQNRVVERIEPGTYQLGARLLELGNLVRARAGGTPDMTSSALPLPAPGSDSAPL
jgi:DNA-binding IclR family transcriptional regulator